MNNKAIIFMKNFSYTLTSNLSTMLISALVILVVPKLIGVEEYGYWQLYLFYSSYVGFLHFGWNDGIYLRYGGKEYNHLNKELFFSQFWMLIVFQLLISIGIFIYCQLFVNNADRLFIFDMIAISILVSNSRIMLTYILQGTNRIKEYAKCALSDRLLYFALIALLLLGGVRDYRLMIVADLIGKLFSLLYAIYYCKDIVLRKASDFFLSLNEALQNINAGIKLMFANIASMLIIGIVRLGIERAWDVSTFGKISLTMSVSSLMMIFINAVGIIMFPVLRRTEKKELPGIYTTMRTLLMAPLLGMLIVYYPLKVILSAWLPQYAESLIYMALVFPMSVYEGKMSLLINTYLKTLRKEKLLLLVNVVSVGLSLLSTFIFVVLLKNLTLSMVSIVILLAFRCIFAEMLLAKILNISLYRDVLLESAMSIIFILTGWFASSWWGSIIYILAYILYLLVKRKEIVMTFKNVEKLVRG